MGVRRLTVGCGKVVWMVWEGCLEPASLVWGDCVKGVGRLSGKYGDAVWSVWKAVKKVWGCCLDCGKADWGVWGRLSGGFGEADCRVWEG